MYKILDLDNYFNLFDFFDKLENKTEAALLDSSLEGDKGKFSILGLFPYLELKEDDNNFYINGELSSDNLENYLASYLKENKIENTTELPLLSGAIAYFSYDYGRKFEKISSRHDKDIKIPEAIVSFYEIFLIQDIEKKKVYLTYRDEDKKNLVLEKIKNTDLTSSDNILKNKNLADFKANFEKDDYLQAIKKTIDYIVEGDIYIMNMTQRLEIESKKNPLEVYKYLRKFNPAPFAAYMDYSDFQIVCASPERFLNLKNGRVQTRPIKGTRRRGYSPEEDLLLKEELKNSEKDKSELLMIVDLERNDLNRVCKTKSVKVTELFEVETYATVFHLVSNIVGDLREDTTVVDLLSSAFPGGSITGAPKIRAMEIIDELENSRRALYTGSIGYIGLDGSCDLNIVIRTALHQNGKYFIGVGGGITCESDLEFEYEETLQKAKALLEAISYD